MRDDLVEMLRRELLGPFDGPDEILRQRPTGRYLVGRLAPLGTMVSPEEDEGAFDTGTGKDDSSTAYVSPISMAMNPSSIGISFAVKSEIKTIQIVAEWGTYNEEKHSVEGKDGNTRKVSNWVRKPHIVNHTIVIANSGEQDIANGVQIQWLIRTLPNSDRRAVSVFLVNRIRSDDPTQPDDSEWLFQPSLLARHPSGLAAFQPRSLDDAVEFEALDLDRRGDELLFRDRPEYAVGHGCAVNWEAEGGTGATEVRTVVLPVHELARINPRESDQPGLDMRRLGGTPPDGLTGNQLVELLSPLAQEYGDWINGLRSRVTGLDVRLQKQAREHIEACLLVYERIMEGIRLLGGSGEGSRLARKAFCFTNRAMTLQRTRSVVALRHRQGSPPLSTDEIPATWRPFQIAFILMNLPPLVDRNHESRRTCDLLWFPTGGGKTEAYLGLAAFVLALRRIRTPVPGYRADGGVGVLMRYTLRLLTVQQFQRATTLVCACEYLRQEEGVWGREPFSIGLWVGRSATPNRYSERDSYWGDGAKEALQKWHDRKPTMRGTPVQLLSCPWCGASLGPDDYEADDYEQRVNIFCSDDDCDFSRINTRWQEFQGIPAHTVDEQVYRNTPSLIIATVDKFAQMAWNGRVQALFGRVQHHCDRHGYITTGEDHPGRHNKDNRRKWPKAEVVDVEPFEPPDLVIQDELHLISGPLGTLVGLYETAVDELASVEVQGRRHPPKVVASTATIRRASQQVHSLFRRSLTVFPPAGLDSTDSWFGLEMQPEEEPGRLYLGVFAPGKSVKTALVRVYATLLSRARQLHKKDPIAGDAYMTLIGYFNSLRELGGAVRLAEDDVPGRIRVLASRPTNEFSYRTLYERHELTSNKRAEEVPKILNWLERQFPAGTPQKGEYPIDVLFASNMISVGVDIDRLGLMVVNGQPKTTAEYIQSTSRVGRKTPGLVTTVYNWTRPRDISHYERFRSYHAGLYRYVEPTSVTPFSSRARDKGLAGVLASLVRQGNAKMAPERAAHDFNSADDWSRQVVELILARAKSLVGPDEAEETRAELRRLVDEWVDLASSNKDLPWSRRGHTAINQGKRWLIDQQEDRERLGVFVAPGSLREVEAEVHLYLLDMTVSIQ